MSQWLPSQAAEDFSTRLDCWVEANLNKTTLDRSQLIVTSEINKRAEQP